MLLNHNDNLDSAFTIAHELGHSMHSFYSNTNQPAPKSDYSLFVAEVASTCNEAIMMRFLLQKYAEEPKAQAYLLNHFLEQFRTTCFRQTMFAEFEKISHEMAQKGQPLTRESLSDAYYKLNETYYGESCVVDPVDRQRMDAHPAFLQRVLRLRLRHRPVRGGIPERKDPERGRARCGGLSEIPQRGLQRAAHRRAEARRDRHGFPGTHPQGDGSLPRNREENARGDRSLIAGA